MDTKCYLNSKKIFLFVLLGSFLGCAQKPFENSAGHLPPVNQQRLEQNQNIPKPVVDNVFLPPPVQRKPEEVFTVVVHDLPANELLFALARDAKMNVDITPGITGKVSLNAIDQTLSQILERLKRQIDIRYRMMGDTLVISPDAPYFVQYSIPYINMTRSNVNSVSISTQVASTGGGAGGDSGGGGEEGGSNSSTVVSSSSLHMFWETLLNNIKAMLRNKDSLRNQENKIGDSEQSSQNNNAAQDSNIVAHQETGIIAVRAKESMQREIRKYIDNVVEHASRQVLIEATIVEVELSDKYQTGVDWSVLSNNGSVSVSSSQAFQDLVLGAAPAINPAALAITGSDVMASIKLLDTFGNTRVLSSPKLMVLNNQAAVLKVVRNDVYFTTSATTETTDTGPPVTTFETELHTVPVGLVMNVIPQISDNNEVIINARPSISRKVAEALDPHPDLAANNIENRIPVIEVREMESILKINDGDIGIIGGLMQDSVDNETEGTPGLSRVPYLDNIFSYKSKENKKTELVVFLRPRIIKKASIVTELNDFSGYLENKPYEFELPEIK